MAIFINGNFLDDDKAVLQVNDLSIQRGYAAFDYLRTVNSQPLFLQDHLNRFTASAKAMHLSLPYSHEKLTEIIHELIRREGIAQAGIRMILTGGYSPDAYNPVQPNLIISCTALNLPSQQDFDKGIRIILHNHQRELPTAKSTNYMMAVWLQPLLREKGAQDVLYHTNNIVTEFPRANVFIVTADNKLVTASKNILAGITRKKILEIAPTIITVTEKEIKVDDLFTAQEVFMTSTTKRILPVVNIDGKIIADGKPGKITKRLYEVFLELEKKT